MVLGESEGGAAADAEEWVADPPGPDPIGMALAAGNTMIAAITTTSASRAFPEAVIGPPARRLLI
jgi:hypothetical protein